MKKLMIITLIQLTFGALAFAAVDNGADLPACKGVTDVCMAASVTATDSKTHQTMNGYEPGEHRKDGKGLWADCVAPLAHGKTVEGVSGVTQASAQACMKAFRAAHPRK